MTIQYKRFVINTTANNIEHEADTRVMCLAGEKINVIGILVSPAASLTNEDVYIKVYKKTDDKTGGGIYHACIDDYTHFVEFNTPLTEGEYVVASGLSASARTLIGAYMYEYIK